MSTSKGRELNRVIAAKVGGRAEWVGLNEVSKSTFQWVLRNYFITDLFIVIFQVKNCQYDKLKISFSTF